MHDSKARERIPCHESEISDMSWSGIVAVSYILFVLDADKNKGVTKVNCGVMESDDLISNLPLGSSCLYLCLCLFIKISTSESILRATYGLSISAFPRRWGERTICRRG